MSIAQEIQRLQSAKANIKSAIEQKGVTVGDGTIDTYAAKIGEISGGGGDNHYDTFWDNYQNNGNRTDYGNAFNGVGWNDTTFKPKYPITISGTSAAMGSSVFAYGNMTEINVDIKLDIASWQTAFNQNRSIVTVKKIVLARDNIEFDRTFQYATNLVNITFEGVIGKSISFTHSSRLSDESVENIIECLADLTGGTAQTLTFHKDVKLLQSQVDSANAKGWTVAGGTVVSEEEYYA
jgi:hypothetical protein